MNTMKLEIEITEEEIRSAIERKIRVAVADQANNYETERYIKEQVKKLWQSTADAMIAEAISNSSGLRQQIASELEKKLRAQLAAAIKNTGKE